MSRSATSFMLRKGQHQPEGNINNVALPLMYPSITKKGPWAAHTQTGGWADICNISAFYHEKAPMFTLSQPTTGYCTLTHPPSMVSASLSMCGFR